MNFEIRPYHPSDLSMLYHICLLTADSGEDGSHLYTDPDLPGQLFAAPHAVYESDICFVLTAAGAPCGYIVGARASVPFHNRCAREWFPVLRTRYPQPEPDDDSPQARLLRTIHSGFKLGADLTDYPAHLHINLLPVAQGQGHGSELLAVFLAQLQALGVAGVHLGVGVNNRRAVRFYARAGFRVIKRTEISLILGVRLTS